MINIRIGVDDYINENFDVILDYILSSRIVITLAQTFVSWRRSKVAAYNEPRCHSHGPKIALWRLRARV